MVYSSKVVLAVGAHPDDIELGCGATLFQAAKKGTKVIAVFMTEGELSASPEIRKQESINEIILKERKITYKPYFYQIIENESLIDVLNGKKAKSEIQSIDFFGTWACDNLKENYTFNPDGTCYGIYNKTDFKGTWEYDESKNELTIKSENFTFWWLILEVGNGYFISGGYFYKIE